MVEIVVKRFDARSENLVRTFLEHQGIELYPVKKVTITTTYEIDVREAQEKLLNIDPNFRQNWGDSDSGAVTLTENRDGKQSFLIFIDGKSFVNWIPEFEQIVHNLLRHELEHVHDISLEFQAQFQNPLTTSDQLFYHIAWRLSLEYSAESSVLNEYNIMLGTDERNKLSQIVFDTYKERVRYYKSENYDRFRIAIDIFKKCKEKRQEDHIETLEKYAGYIQFILNHWGHSIDLGIDIKRLESKIKDFRSRNPVMEYAWNWDSKLNITNSADADEICQSLFRILIILATRSPSLNQIFENNITRGSPIPRFISYEWGSIQKLLQTIFRDRTRYRSVLIEKIVPHLKKIFQNCNLRLI